MKSLFCIPVLVAVVGCTPSHEAKTAAQTTSHASLIEEVHDIVDKNSHERLGVIEMHRYENDRVIYWVKDTKDVKRGFITPANSAYKFDWLAGRRSAKPDFVGADTMVAGARKILGHPKPVRFEQTSLEEIARRKTGNRYDRSGRQEEAPAGTPPADEAEEGCGCGDE